MSIEDAELWKTALAGIQELTKGRTNGNLTHLKYHRSDGNRLVIKVNGPKQERDWLNDRLREAFERELWRLTQRFYVVEFLNDIPTMKVMPSAGDRYGRWIEWPPEKDMPVVAGCWMMTERGSLRSGYTPEELSRALQMIGRIVPALVAAQEMRGYLRKLEFISQGDNHVQSSI